MTIFFSQYLDILKDAILVTAGIKNITPCDCKAISVQIFKKTKCSVSETTLKRVYGFALSKFKPSVFTIDVLAKYCGYDGWDDFCQKQAVTQPGSRRNLTNWDTLKQSAGKITGFTLQALKNKSGIPYNQTIKRRFIDDHFNEFLNGGYTATVLSAPAGYGKTIGLCHWVEEHLTQNAQGKTDDIVLFFSGSALMNVFLSGRNLNDWILALLGYSVDEDVRSLIEMKEKVPGNFYLIVDNLDEHIYKQEQFKLLFNQLVDIFSMYQSAPWFKMIVTMRAATWLNNRHQIDGDAERWFTGFDTGEEAINVPLFSIQEIKELCIKINPDIQNFLALDIANSFNHPLYFQFYYKQNRDNFSLSKIDHICIYDLISAFILNKVYLGQYSAEKVLLLNALVDEMDLAGENFDVYKLKVNNILKQYNQAYGELLSIGFLRELNTSSDANYQTVIKFGNNNFLEYTIAKALLTKNNNAFDATLINTINTQLVNSPQRLQVLKWCIIYAIKTSQQKSFELLAKTNLNPAERSDLIIFLGELLDKSVAADDKSESLVQYFKQDCSTNLFNFFFGLEFITAQYKETLLTLLKFNLSNNKRILIYTALAYSAVLRLDIKELEAHVVKLSSFPAEDYARFAINPLTCVDALYNYYRHGIFKKNALAEITHFYFNPPLEGGYFENNASNELIYLVAIYTLLFLKQPVKIARLINVLEKHYKKSCPASLNGYDFFMSILLADSYYSSGKTDKLLAIYEGIRALYKQNNNSFTYYMKTVYYGLRIKAAIRLQKYKTIIEDTRSCLQVAGDNRASKVYLLAIIINCEDIANLYPQFYKQCYYNYTKLLRECGLPTEAFSATAPYI